MILSLQQSPDVGQGVRRQRGQSFQFIPQYEFEAPLLKELRAIQEQTAKGLGHLRLEHQKERRPSRAALWIELDYCASCAFIISWILALRASRLKEAGSCIGG